MKCVAGIGKFIIIPRVERKFIKTKLLMVFLIFFLLFEVEKLSFAIVTYII